MTELVEKKTIAVLGCGEIGTPLYRLSRGGYAQVLAIDRLLEPPSEPLYEVEALHIAIPGVLEDFVSIVSDHIKKYDPNVVMVHATTPPGTTAKLVDLHGAEVVVHSQVHGKHHGNRMQRDMLHHKKFVGTTSDAAFKKAKKVLVTMGHAPDEIKRLSSTTAGEVAKLLATTFFGYLVVWTQEVERISAKSGIPYEDLMVFTELETADFDIKGKSPGYIGGHCVMPNIDLLSQFSKSPLWDFTIESNELKGKS